MKIEVTGEARKATISKRLADGSRVKLRYTFVPTSHGKLVVFDQFAKKIKPKSLVRVVQRAFENERNRDGRVVKSRAGNIGVLAKFEKTNLKRHSLREALILEDLHHNGVRCEVPLAVFLTRRDRALPGARNILLTVKSKHVQVTLRPPHLPESIARRLHSLGVKPGSSDDFEPLDLEVLGRYDLKKGVFDPRVVVDVENFRGGMTNFTRPRKIHLRAKRILREAARV